jgi:hypothetical protein
MSDTVLSRDRFSVYTAVTNDIVEAIEAGAERCVCPIQSLPHRRAFPNVVPPKWANRERIAVTVHFEALNSSLYGQCCCCARNSPDIPAGCAAA